MERFSQRENVLLGYSPQRALGSQSSSPKAPARDAEVDFNDVFGGPPRRVSAAEVRSSFGDTASSSSARGEDDRASPRNPWTGLSEMPVFGEESSNRRRYPSDDFYDDIFRGDDSVNSPRRSEWDTPGSSSRVLSPARRPLPQRADPYSTSLPSQFQLSLPGKSTKAIDYSAFSPGNLSPRTQKDPSSSGISPPSTSKSSLSRTVSAALEEDELGNNMQPSYRPSPLSHEHSRESMDPAYLDKSEELETPKLKKDLKSTEASKDSYQFHFSIYRWASKGVPFSMPLRSSNLKGTVKMERCSTYSGRIASENMASGLQKAIWGNESDDLNLLNHSISASKVAPNVEGSKLESNSSVKASTNELSKESLPKGSEKGVATKVQIKNKKVEEAKKVPLSEILFPGSTKKGVDMTTEAAQEPQFKPLGANEQGGDKITGKTEAKDQMAKNTAKSHSNSDVKRSVNKPKEKRAASNKVEVNQVDESLPQGSSTKSVDNRARKRDKGKVKDFVKIFNQEAPSESKPETGSQSQRSQWKGTTSTSRGDREEIANTTQTNRKPHDDNLNEAKPLPSSPIKVAKNLESEYQQSKVKTTGFKLEKNASGQKDATESSSKPLPDGPTVIIEDIDDIFQENFTIKEISNDQEKKPESEEGYEDTKMLDLKIQKWSNGKKGNIRSLLSTLQQVLWPGSGWKPVPLVGIIEGNGVKRAYQKAMLCLHPDKLQQKGAAAHQKYIAEKVFDILQEAWDHFNTLGGM